MTEPACSTGCGRPSPDSALCAQCFDRAERDLAEIPGLLSDLDVTLAKQARIGSGKRGIGHSQPLPMDLGAMTALDLARLVLTAWVQTIMESDGLTDWPGDDLTDMALWLLGRIGWARRSDEAAQFCDEIGDLRRLLTRAVDRPPELAYAGPCWAGDDEACGADLYARLGARVVTCAVCGAEYDAAVRRAWLLDACMDRLETATTIANALTGLLQPVTPSMVRQMAFRHELYSRSEDLDGRPLYRLGDVRDILGRRVARQAEKARMSA